MEQQQFKQQCLSQLIRLFTDIKNQQADEKHKNRVQGFMAAGKFMGLLSHQEGQTIIEQAHQQVFGESIVRRQSRKQTREYSVIDYDDDYFNVDTIWR